MQEATKHVTVLLDGQGADEMMAGYLPYYPVYFRQLIKEKKYRTLLKSHYFH
jgi:asparagine synthase (glutamine-hydrolysing)